MLPDLDPIFVWIVDILADLAAVWHHHIIPEPLPVKTEPDDDAVRMLPPTTPKSTSASTSTSTSIEADALESTTSTSSSEMSEEERKRLERLEKAQKMKLAIQVRGLD